VISTPWAIKRSQLIFVCNFVKNQHHAFFTVRFNDERYTWWYELNPPHLINAATLPCDSQNTAKCNITLWYYQRKYASNQMYYTASSKWTCRLQNLGCYAAMRVWNKDLWHQQPAEILDTNLVWLWTERYWGCNWPVAWLSEIIVCARGVIVMSVNTYMSMIGISTEDKYLIKSLPDYKKYGAKRLLKCFLTKTGLFFYF